MLCHLYLISLLAPYLCFNSNSNNSTHTRARLTALCLGLPGWAGTRKVKPIWILLKQETVSGSSISWAICNSAPRSRQITTPAPRRSVIYRLGALPATQPTATKHWRHMVVLLIVLDDHCDISNNTDSDKAYVAPVFSLGPQSEVH